MIRLLCLAGTLLAAGCSSLQSVPMAGTLAGDLEVRHRSFRNGTALQLGGREYADAVALNSCGSFAYNLDGLAESFTARIGIEDGAPAHDKLQFDILIDRKTWKSFTFSPGDPVRELTIPLSGARQLEFAIQYGPEQRTLPLVFADAKFHVRNKAAFLEALIRWRNRIDVIRYSPLPPVPAMPDWKHIKAESFRYGNFCDGWRIGNGVIELEIAPEFGGRIVGFRRSGGKNILRQPPIPGPADLRRGRGHYYSHTHFSRPEPEVYSLPGEKLHLFGPYRLRFGDEGEIIMTSLPSYLFFLQTEYRIRMRPNSDELEVETRLRNLADFPFPCGIWSVTVLTTAEIEAVQMPSQTVHDTAEPEGAAAELRQGKDCRELRQPFKLGTKYPYLEFRNGNRSGLLRVRLKSGELFTKEMLPADGEAPPPHRTHVYLHEDFTEIEGHSPAPELPPGGEIVLKERWKLE